MTPGVRLAILAGLLIAGEFTGFAASYIAVTWPWFASAGILLAMIAYGWSIRHALPFFVFLYGFVAAMRTESIRAGLLERHWWSGGRRGVPVLELPVESDVRIYYPAKGGVSLEFYSHLGVIPLKAVLRGKDIAFDSIPVYGETWRCAGWISRQTIRPGVFSRRMFWGKVDGVAERTALPPMSSRRLRKLSSECAEKAAIGLGWCPELASINRAILLGDRTALSKERRKVFASAGTIHVFAISGLHVMLIALLLVRGLSLLSVPVRARGLVVAPALVAYVLVTGMRPSAVRAAMMASICLLAPSFGRKGDSLVAWSVTALCVYGFFPERIFDTGCTLSFTAMFGIVVWLKWVFPLLPERGREGIFGECGVSFAAWTAGVPAVAHVFGCFTPGGLLSNVVVLRLAGCLVSFGMAGMAFGYILPPVAAVFNNLAAVMAWTMCQVSTAVASLPFASFTVEPWPWWACMAWYCPFLACIALLTWLARKRSYMWWH